MAEGEWHAPHPDGGDGVRAECALLDHLASLLRSES
jgi:hypothetical protein